MTDYGPDDPLPALRAELDQAMMMAPEVARAARAFFEAFKQEGFTEAQSCYLTISQILSNPGKAP